MRNEEAQEFTPINEEIATQLREHIESAKLVFKPGEVVEVKGRQMRVLHVYRRSIVLRPTGW